MSNIRVNELEDLSTGNTVRVDDLFRKLVNVPDFDDSPWVTASTADEALDALELTELGKSIVKSVTTSSVQDVIGMSTKGKELASANNAADIRTAAEISISTQQQAVDGINNTTHMTPLRVKQAIDGKFLEDVDWVPLTHVNNWSGLSIRRKNGMVEIKGEIARSIPPSVLSTICTVPEGFRSDGVTVTYVVLSNSTGDGWQMWDVHSHPTGDIVLGIRSHDPVGEGITGPVSGYFYLIYVPEG